MEIKNLSFSHGKKRILDSVSFEPKSGEVCVIIGPNGAGKSTLLKCLCKIYEKSGGEALLDGGDISSLSIKEVAKRVAFMAQFLPNSHLKSYEVLELARRVYSGFLLSSEDRDIIKHVVDELGLERFLYREIDSLSGGERQMVYLAQALIQTPKILLLDEPTAHLDPKNQIEILEIVKNETRNKNLTTLIVLHDLQSALHFGDRVLMLKEGRLFLDVRRDELKEEHLSELFGLPCKIFWNDGHPFVLFGHDHARIKNHTHLH